MSLSFFEMIAEQRIKQAMENGEFDNLPLHGKPLPNAFIRGKMCFTGGADWTISKADGSFVLISEYPINQLKVTAPGLSVETRSILCGILNAGDVRLERLDLDMAVSPPSTCP